MPRKLGNIFYSLIDMIPQNLRSKLAHTRVVYVYRKMAHYLGNQGNDEYKTIKAGPIRGYKLCIGNMGERGYISVREYLSGTYEPSVAKAIINYCKVGGTVFDIGAHYGYFSLLMAHCVGENGKCIAFEANLDNYRKILNSIRINQSSNLHVEHIAISNQIGKVPFYRHQNSLMGRIINGQDQIHQGEIEYVDTVTIDEYVRCHDYEDISFMKIDVEGAEMDVITGAEETISKYRPTLLVEVHNFPEISVNAERLVRRLLKHNYRVMYLGTELCVAPESFSGGHILAVG